MQKVAVNIGDIKLQNGCPIVIQTMCNCDTDEVEKAVAQCELLSAAGAGLIRLTTQGLREVDSLRQIKEHLRSKGIGTPLVADVHFSSEVAIEAAKVVEKVRINPGNFAKDHDTACSQFKRLIAVCKEHGTVLRIGINHGSLGSRITELYGNTSKGMVEAMKEWVKMCLEEDFFSIVLSLKASNTVVMVDAYRLLYRWMEETGYIFPLHLGVTEAGNGDMGRIKSAVAMSTLLSEGIGETIRVSLTEDPVKELPAARLIADYFDRHQNLTLSSFDVHAGIPDFSFHSESFEEFIIKASCTLGPLLMNHVINDFIISGTCGGKNIETSVLEDFKSNILQAARKRFDKCEYIACPSCGRTLYDIEKTFDEVKRRTAHLKGMSIAVMGCIVNGPGEMADADWGYVGEGKGKVAIYKGKTVIRHSVPQEEAIDILLTLIEQENS